MLVGIQRKVIIPVSPTKASMHFLYRRSRWVWALLVVFVFSNVGVAVHYVGTRAGQTYYWICRETGAEIYYRPSEFGAVSRYEPGTNNGSVRRWELIEPLPLSAWRPWNWLALLMSPPAPNPETLPY
jgi:hypothetical protein